MFALVLEFALILGMLIAPLISLAEGDVFNEIYLVRSGLHGDSCDYNLMLQDPFYCTELANIGIIRLDTLGLSVQNSAAGKINVVTSSSISYLGVRVGEEVLYKSTCNDYSLTIIIIEEREDKYLVCLKVDGVLSDWVVSLGNCEETQIDSIPVDDESSECVDLG